MKKNYYWLISLFVLLAISLRGYAQTKSTMGISTYYCSDISPLVDQPTMPDETRAAFQQLFDMGFIAEGYLYFLKGNKLKLDVNISAPKELAERVGDLPENQRRATIENGSYTMKYNATKKVWIIKYKDDHFTFKQGNLLTLHVLDRTVTFKKIK